MKQNRHHMTFQEEDFVRIHKDYILSAEEGPITFDIYTSFVERGLSVPILLYEKNSRIDGINHILAAKNYKKLFIKRNEIRKFEAFLEHSISTIIADKKLPLDKKSRVIHKCAKNILKDVFTDPRSGKHLVRTKKVTNEIIDFILTHKNSIPQLLQLGSHDYYTFSHCVNVAVFAIGLWMMISKGTETELREFALGCILHDVGKAEIPDTILKKPGKLNNHEFETIKTHPHCGFEIMAGTVPDTALDVILHHHEKFNGTGYPNGLLGDRISDNAKISTLADVYDALTTNRPYSPARTPYDAVKLMKEEMLNYFDREKFIKFIYFLSGSRNDYLRAQFAQSRT